MLLELLQQSPVTFFIVAGVLVYSLALHELGHAWVAMKMGDYTAKHLGRVTLNPIPHLDPLGSILILFTGFGWARPVPIRPDKFRNFRLGMFMVSIAGVVVNFLIALLTLGILAFLGLTMVDGRPAIIPGTRAAALAMTSEGVGLINGLDMAARINILLVVFNLLPVPPLDGSKVLQAFLPLGWQKRIWQLERYGFLIVILLVTVFQEQVWWLVGTVIEFMMNLILA